MEPLVKFYGPVDRVNPEQEDGFHPLPEEVAEKIREAAISVIRSSAQATPIDDPGVLVLENPVEPDEETKAAETEAILNEIDEDDLIRLILEKDTRSTEDAIREMVRREVARAAEEARTAEHERTRREAETPVEEPKAPTEADLKREERRRAAEEEAREAVEAARVREEEYELRAKRLHSDMIEQGGNAASATVVSAPEAFAGSSSGTDEEAPDLPELLPATESYVQRAQEQQVRKWDTVADHEMPTRTMWLWRVGVYCTFLAFPLFLFMASPYSPADTMAHHLTGFSCSFAESMGTTNAKAGEPGYHARFDDNGNGVSCEKATAPRTFSRQSVGNARFVRP